MNLTASRSAHLPTVFPGSAQKLTVTLVICTRNRAAELRACLEKVRELDPPADEVLVVDNSPGDDATRAAAEQFGARYTIEPMQGLSRARNRGIRESTGDVVAYLDDDAVPDARWLGELVAPFADPAVAASAGRVLPPGATPAAARPEEPRSVSNKNPLWFEIAAFGGLGLGCNMAMRKSACGSGKIFDERLGRGAPFRIGEESCAFAKLLLRGYTAAYVPSAIVLHPPKWEGLEQESRNSITYGLLLLSEFPKQRWDLVQFLIRRFRREPLPWPRDSQEPGQIVNSSWGMRLRAGLSALYLFLRTPKPRED